MSYTSFFFFLFLGAVVLLYFLFPRRYRFLVLLIASIYFYCDAGVRGLPFLLLDSVCSYAAALLLQRFDRKVNKIICRTILICALVLIVGCLVVFKILRFSDTGSAMPLGLSYYTFSTVGYVLDVYWRRYEAERNYLKYILFVSFFPHIVQGPIPRYGKLGSQLAEGHTWSYRRACFGAQLMLWGLFQKLVLADRLSVFVDTVFAEPGGETGVILAAAAFFYAIQIYTDFAGCVNIARGMAQIFGIELEQNFRQPYFSQSVEEFWRRWHITLGAWFRDYVGMPVSICKPVKNLSRKMRKKHGSEAGMLTASLSALVVVWLCTGLWHGTGLNYLLWALWQGGIIAFSQIFRKRLVGLRERLHIRETSKGFQLFRIFRTFILAGIIPRVITRAPSLKAAAVIMIRIVRNPGFSHFRDKGIKAYGWTRYDVMVTALSLLILLIVSILKEKNIQIREKIASWVFPLRWAFYLAVLFTVVIFGIYGPKYDASSFVYADF